jgi:hypothetical protein
LGKNSIGDEGSQSLSKALSNIPLKSDEIASRLKIMAEQEKVRLKEPEELDPKKLKRGSRAPSGKIG